MARTSSKRRRPARRKAHPAHAVKKAAPPHEKPKRKSDFPFIAFMIVTANLLGSFAISGPLNIHFSLTAVPILVVALTRGWQKGSITGLLGGVVQAYQYGSLWYVFYTYIIGLVAGYLAFNAKLLGSLAPPVVGLGGFLMFWSVDITKAGAGAGNIPLAIPFRGIAGFVVFFGLSYLLVNKLGLRRGSFLLMMLAGCVGAVAYVPYDLSLLILAQGFPLAPALMVLAKDVAQDFAAAVIAGLLLQLSLPRVE
jgi:hypothetical protein